MVLYDKILSIFDPEAKEYEPDLLIAKMQVPHSQLTICYCFKEHLSLPGNADSFSCQRRRFHLQGLCARWGEIWFHNERVERKLDIIFSGLPPDQAQEKRFSKQLRNWRFGKTIV